MRLASLNVFLFFAILGAPLFAQTPPQKMSVTGKLVRVMAIGAESTGWAVQLDSPVTIDGKQADSIQVFYSDASRLEKLENKHVKAAGKLTQRQGVETGAQPVLALSSIKEAKSPPVATPSSSY